MKKNFSQVFESIRQENKSEFKPVWSKTGKEAVHRETGEKTHEYAEIGHDGKPTGKREYRNTQGKPMGESVQQEKIDPTHKKILDKEKTSVPKKPKGEYERQVDKYLKKKYSEEVEQVMEAAPFKTKEDAVKYAKEKVKTHRDNLDGIEIYAHSGGFDVNHTMNANGRNSLQKIKAKHLGTIYKEETEQVEEVEHLEEGRPSQRHPLEGHDYHKKSDEALVHIAKDAHAAAEAMKGHNTDAENKYRDQANDSATVRHFRKTSGMPEWYKKKYGHIKEAKDEGEYGYEGDMALNQLATLIRCAEMIEDLLKPDTDMPEWVQSKITLATDYIQTAADYMYSEMKDMKEDVPFDPPYKKLTGVVTDKSGAKHGPMSQARNLARQAMKAVGDKQKNSLKPAKSFTESKKTEIVKDVIKGKKMKDKFEAEPIISNSPDTKGTIDN